MNAVTQAYWASFGLMWAFTIATVVHLHRKTVVLQQATADISGFAHWANWTVFTVTDRQGNINCWTLRQMYDWQEKERIWADPISVTIRAANGELHQKWQNEATALFSVPPEQENEAP